MSRRLAFGGVVAALYVVLVVALAPISFGPIQFRIADILQPVMFYDPVCVPALAVGLVAANLFSPYAGPWELLFMPVIALGGGYLSWWLSRRLGWWTAGVVYALCISAGVAIMLNALLGIPLFVALWPVAVAEVIIVSLGVPLVKKVTSLKPMRK